MARELSFSRTDIDAIVHREKDDLKEQIYLFFEDWKRKDGSGATVQKLIMAIKAAELEPEVLAELQHVIPGTLIVTAIHVMGIPTLTHCTSFE